MSDISVRAQLDIVPWSSSFETGIAIIDEQHQRLVALINDLAHAFVQGGSVSEIERVLDALLDYAAYHFEAEEHLWAEVLLDDSWYTGHLETHASFFTQVADMRAQLYSADDADSAALLDELLAFLTSWLAHHILYEDKRFSLAYLQLRDGVDIDAAKHNAVVAMTGQTSKLIQNVLVMYKELSARTLNLERAAHLREVAEQELLKQKKNWSSVLRVGGDNLWDWDFSTVDPLRSDERVIAEQFTQGGLHVHEEDWPGLYQAFMSYLLGRSDVFLHQHRVLDASGHLRWVQSRGKIIEQDAQGRPLRMVGTQTDITERKTTELTLRRERDTRALISDFAADFMASSTDDFDAAINRALQRSGEYMQADRTYVFLVSADGYRMNNTHEWCAAGVEPEIANLQGIPSSALPWWWSQFRDVGYVLVPRVSEMPAEAQNEYQILASQDIQSVCVYPLYIGKELVGFMGSDSVGQERDWGQEVIEFLSLMSDLVSIALGHRQLHEKRAHAISQLQRAEEYAHLGHWHVDYTTQTVTWSQEMYRILECDPACFTPELDSYAKFLHPDDHVGLLSAYESAKAAQGDLYFEHKLVLEDQRVKYLELRGRFNVIGNALTDVAEGTVQDITEKVEHRETLERLAFQDALTGLPNRRAFEDQLAREIEHCQRHDRHLVLALLDLDDFRAANERYGIDVGDALLTALANRIRHLFKESVLVARVGGDEFAVLLTQMKHEDGYFQQLNRLLAVVNKPLLIKDAEIVLTASIGVAEYPQPTDIVGEQLLRQAQQALFQAKILGKGRFHKYDLGSEQDARALTGRLDEVRKALYDDELVLYYQPKVHMKTGVVFGVEALVRWRKSTGELVPPSDFLPALYNHPLEVELGDWVIRTALAQMSVWQEQGLQIQVSVNVSGLQLFESDFVEKLSLDLQAYPDVSPTLLQLEVLESSALNDLEMVSVVMQRSRDLGVSFALDDFGTGYSSLAYLKHLPASVLKIDQSFVRGMMENTDDLDIISGVVGMAKAFGLQVLAEGVESVEHGHMLLRLGCEQGQGYGIARPMPASELVDWVRNWQTVPAWAGQTAVDTSHLPLLYAEVEHRRWVVSLKKLLHGETNTAPVLDHHQCRVGIWIDSEAHQLFAGCTKFAHVVYLHKELHALGRSAISLYTKGEVESALMLIPEIRMQRDDFLTVLRTLIG